MIFFVVQFLLVGLVLVLPCALMGGTLPILARWLVGREYEIGGRVAVLYAANTLGACAGAAAATYVLLPFSGVREGELVAVAMNLAAGAVALLLARASRGPRCRKRPRRRRLSSTRRFPSPGERALLLAIALSGFAAMVDEVAWARLVGLIFSSSVYAFGLMLLLFLAGIGIGSAIYARLRAGDPARVLGAALVGNTFAALLGIALVPQLPFAYMRGFPAVKDSFAFREALQLVATAPLLLPMAILFGIAFPAAVAATARLRDMGRGVGRVTAWNTLGTVAGAFLGGFVLIPRIGMRASLTLAAASTAVAGVLALSRSTAHAWRTRGLVAAGAALRRRAAAAGVAAQPARHGHGLLRDHVRRRARPARRRAPVRAALLQGRDRDDAVGGPPGLRPLLPLERQDRRVHRSGRHGQPAPARPPPHAAAPRSAGGVRDRARDRRLRGGCGALSRPVDRDRRHRGRGPRRHAAVRGAEPQRARRPARAVPRRRRPQRPARARQGLRRHHLRSVRRVGRRRRQPLHAGVLLARAQAAEAGRRDGAVVPHALAPARADEADRRDVSIGLSRTRRCGAPTTAT